MKNIAKTKIMGSGIRAAVILVTVLLSLGAYGQDPNQNYVMTKTYKVAESAPITNTDPNKVAIEITYIDGLGRAKQKIAHQQSGSGNDLITHIAYDGFGRQPLEFLPYERSGASLDFDGNGFSSTTAFYSNPANGPTTSNPWSEKIFEDSPLNRVLKQAAPGNEWAKASSNGHEVKFSHETNTAAEVHHFSVSLGGAAPSLAYEGKYPEGQLYKSVTKDENWHTDYGNKGTVSTFTDKMGRMVLKRIIDVPIGEGKEATGSIALDTYYIYDAYGNLTFVLPPKLSENITGSGTVTQTLLNNLGYQYQYDHRNRMIAKRVPGKDHWDYMVYDDLDRITATGPALSPFGDGAEGWLHTKYDIHNRVAYTLWKEGPVGKAEQEEMSRTTPTHISEFRLPGISPTVVNGVSFSYSNQVAPTSGYHVLTVSYYDDYGYTGAPTSIPTTVAEGESTVYYNNAASTRPKGLPTGSWVRQLETAAQANAIRSYPLYDKKARPVRVLTSNPASGYTQSDTKYDFIGNPLTTITKHKKNAAAQVLVLTDYFTYTAQSRPLGHTHRINTGSEQLLSLNSYDALGRLKSKKVGRSESSPLQKVDYSYNIRGWMTGINNIHALSESGAPLDLFAFYINYTHVSDDINGAVEPLYNGNIAETFWRTSSDNMVRKYGYSYDYQNRLLDAWYQRPGTSVPRSDSYSAHYSYDRNGNLLTLERNGEQDLASSTMAIDELSYTYDNNGNSNRLINVSDAETPAGYDNHNTNQNEEEFGYDAYGNIVRNKDKQITAITYNHLNLPVKITFGTGGKIEYFYDATGIKLKKRVTQGLNITNTDYMDGFQYTDNILDFFPHAEGYVKAVSSSLGGPGSPTSVSYKYVFNYTDHLGNIRLKYAQDPANGNQISILEEDHYYPYGLKHKGYSSSHLVFAEDDSPGAGIILTPVNPFLGDSYKYKFGGKEYQTEFDINTYDFGARNYDPALGRWMNIDPLAEMMRRHSPYNYAFNNPIYFIDPDGMEAGGFANINPATSTGSMDVMGGYDVSTYDENKNIIDTQYFANVNDAGNLANAVGQKIFDNQVNATFGDEADKPAEPSQENVDKTIDKVPILNGMQNNFKDKVPITFVDVFKENGDNALTTGSGTFYDNVEIAVYRGAFDTYRILAHTLYHEFIHVHQFQSLFGGSIIMQYTKLYGETKGRLLSHALLEVKAYEQANKNIGTNYTPTYYNLKQHLKDDKVKY